MCICIEFVMQVLKQKNAHVSFPVEMVSIAQGVRATDVRTSAPGNDSNATKTSVRAPRLSADEREHPFVSYFGAG